MVRHDCILVAVNWITCMVVGVRANEYIKQYGLDNARELVETSPLEKREDRTDIRYYKGGFFELKHTHLDVCVDVNKLKHLIESHELIGKIGGLKKAVAMRNKLSKESMVNLTGRALQAIADVESCQ